MKDSEFIEELKSYACTYSVAAVVFIVFIIIVVQHFQQNAQRTELMAHIDTQIERIDGMKRLSNDIGIFYANEHYRLTSERMGFCKENKENDIRTYIGLCLMSLSQRSDNPTQSIINSMILTGDHFITPDILPLELRERASN